MGFEDPYGSFLILLFVRFPAKNGDQIALRVSFGIGTV